MSAKRERATLIDVAGAESTIPVGVLLVDPPRARAGGRSQSKPAIQNAGGSGQEGRSQGERSRRRVDLRYIVSQLLATGDDDTDGTLIRVCAALREVMGWDEVTFWPADGHAGVLRSRHDATVSAHAVAMSTGDSRIPVPFMSRIAVVSHVFATGQPKRLTDETPATTPANRAPEKAVGGWSTFAFAVCGAAGLLGVIECLGTVPRSPGAARRREAAALGAMIGGYLEHQYAQQQPTHGEAPPPRAERRTEGASPTGAADWARRLEDAFNTLGDSVVIFDRDGRILWVNDADQVMLGYERGSTTFTTLLRERERQLMARDESGQSLSARRSPFARILRGEAVSGQQTIDATLRRPDGREIQVSISGAPLADGMGRLMGGVVITRDVSEQRCHERTLQDENQLMHELLAVAAHDLKTPISASNGYVQLALRRLNKLEDAAATAAPTLVSYVKRLHTYLEDVEQNSQRLARLVERLLDHAHIQAHKLVMRAEPVDVAAIIRTKVREQRLATPARAIRYKAPLKRGAPTLADPDRIGQVLLNYLTNALKYSPENSAVEVTLDVRDTVARVSVRDAGPGIPASERERIWLRFEQLNDERQRGSEAGLGLGLYISRAIIEAHGGHVGVESEVGHGSTFWFDLPLAPHHA